VNQRRNRGEPEGTQRGDGAKFRGDGAFFTPNQQKKPERGNNIQKYLERIDK
jgi:hypothetical protein